MRIHCGIFSEQEMEGDWGGVKIGFANIEEQILGLMGARIRCWLLGGMERWYNNRQSCYTICLSF